MASSFNIDRLIIAELNGNLTQEEQIYLSEWKNDPENQKTYNDTRSLLLALSGTSDYKLFDGNQAWNRLEPSLIQNSNRKSFFYIRIAASFIILLCTIFIFNLINPKSDSVLFERNFMPDGSEIVMTSNSIIKVSEDFNQELRELEFDGKAFFHVKHDEDKRFIISTPGMDLEVLGTSFVIDSENEYVHVRDGKVLVKSVIGQEVELVKDDLFYYSNNTKENKSFEIFWNSDSVKFVDEPVKNVLNVLGLAFPNQIHIEMDNIDPECKISTQFKNESILDLLEELSLLFKIDYVLDGNGLTVLSLECK